MIYPRYYFVSGFLAHLGFVCFLGDEWVEGSSAFVISLIAFVIARSYSKPKGGTIPKYSREDLDRTLFWMPPPDKDTDIPSKHLLWVGTCGKEGSHPFHRFVSDQYGYVQCMGFGRSK